MSDREKSRRFALVVAHDSKLGIGKDNSLPWTIGKDLGSFRKLTSAVCDQSLSNIVIMGRKTWQTIPAKHSPLQGRTNIVLTRNQGFAAPEPVLINHSFDAAISRLESLAFESCFIIGGASVYKEAIQHLRFDTIHVTEVFGDFDCDVFIPEYRDKFDLVKQSKLEQEGPYTYQFKIYLRKSD